jgi:hypothetical protein
MSNMHNSLEERIQFNSTKRREIKPVKARLSKKATTIGYTAVLAATAALSVYGIYSFYKAIYGE